jgi:CheY-like chemotaxis protein
MSKSILVADDSITIRKVVELTFAETGIRVESVGSGREALDRIAELRPDLVLADVVMPEPSGYDVCRAVKTSARPVPVLLLAEPFDPERARGVGADGHLIKPFESRTLVERVEALLSGPPAPVPPQAPPPAPPAEELESVLDDLAAATPPAPAAEPPVQEIETLLEEADPVAPDLSAPSSLSEGDLRRLAELVVSRLAEQVVREVAWEVVPETAERLVRERLRQLEREEPD